MSIVFPCITENYKRGAWGMGVGGVAVKALEINFEILDKKRESKATYEGKEIDLVAPVSNSF